MPLVLYTIPYSQPVRSTLMLIKALGLEVELKEVSLINKQQYSSEFLELNPQHTVPTLIDDGFILWDSHAIMPYLMDKYAQDDSLYPKDLQKRAIVEQRLHFDNGVLFPLRIIGPMIYEGVRTVPKEEIPRAYEAYGVLEKFLNQSQFVAGDRVTIADLSIVATITSLNIVLPIDEGQYPNIVKWIQRMEELPYYDINVQGIESMKKMLGK